MHYFQIPHVRPEDAGEITCIAKNGEGEISVRVPLDVLIRRDFRFHQLQTVTGPLDTPEKIAQKEATWRREALGTLGKSKVQDLEFYDIGDKMNVLDIFVFPSII